MSLPINHRLYDEHVGAFSPSIGASPQAVYSRSPFSGYLKKITCVTGGTITTADCTMTVKNETTGVTLGTFTVTVSGAAAAQLFSYIPDTAAHAAVTQDDVISITPSGASGSSIAGYFCATYSAAAPA